MDGPSAVDRPTWYRDGDHDGLGNPRESVTSCLHPPLHVPAAGDCDDTDAEVGAPWVGEDCEAPFGTCDPALGRLRLVPDEHATIQAALDASDAGDVVCVAPGVWYENLTLPGRSVNLVGAAGASETILDGGGVSGVIAIINGEPDDLWIEGFTVRNGVRRDGGGVWVRYRAPTDVVITLRDLVLHGNYAEDDGGAVHVSNAGVVLDGVLAWGNSAGDSGGAARIVGSTAEIRGSEFTDNLAGGSGGALGLREITATIEDTRLEGNSAGASGGAMELYYADARLIGLDVVDNTAVGSGGGVRIDGERRVNLTRVVARGNVSGADGGGIFVQEGIRAEWASVVLADNEAGGDGGGLYLAASCPITVRNTTVVGNRGRYGAGIAAGSPCLTGGSASFEGVIVAFNEGAGGGVRAPDAEALVFSYSDVYGNGADWAGMDDPAGTAGNVSVDPGLLSYASPLDAATWALMLATDSPLWGAGDPARPDVDGASAQPGAWGGPDAGDWYDYYADADADGLYDGWETAWGLAPGADGPGDDPDGDLLTNAEELAAGTSPTRADTDEDTVDDGAEVAAGRDPLSPG